MKIVNLILIQLFILLTSSTSHFLCNYYDDENQSDDNIDLDDEDTLLTNNLNLNTFDLFYEYVKENNNNNATINNEFNTTKPILSNSICSQSIVRCLFLSFILGCLILFTIIGNSFVIAAVILERNLHSVANYLIVSLAFADLTVAIMVMPIGAYQEVFQEWSLGKILCDIWTIFDVLCCTASILHLVAIALDRYWAITKFGYAAVRTSKRIFTMIALIWSVSLTVAITPHIFGLSYDVNNTDRCHLTDNLTYQLVSTVAAFYLPLIGMCIIYWNIFRTAKLRIRKKAFKNQTPTSKRKNDDKMEKKEEKIRVQENDLVSTSKSSEQSSSIEKKSKTYKNYSVYSFDKSKVCKNMFDNGSVENAKTTTSDDNSKTKSSNLNELSLTSSSKLKMDSEHDKSLYMYKDTSFYDIKTAFVSVDYDALSSSLEYMSLNQVEVTIDDTKTDTKLIKNEENVEKKYLLHVPDDNKMETSNNNTKKHSLKEIRRVSNILKKRAEIDMKRERKAAKTLGVIMSCFIICWLPYFLMQIFFAVCKNCYVTRVLENSFITTFLTWSGYLNSLLNPVIYTIFSPDFRSAFAKILYAKYRLK